MRLSKPKFTFASMLVLTLMCATIMYAQNGQLPTLDDVADAVDSQTGASWRIINTIVGIILGAGAIPIIGSLLGRNVDKRIIVGWVVGLVVWILANALFNR